LEEVLEEVPEVVRLIEMESALVAIPLPAPISRVIEPPRPTKPPLIKPAPALTVRLELIREEVAILDKVLLEPEMVLLVRVWLASKVTIVPEALGKVKTVLSVPEKVRLLLTVKVLALAIVKVALVAGAVINSLLREVAAATPILGVVKVGEVARTIEPVPVVALPKTVTVPPVLGKVKAVASVPEKVRELLTAKVLLAAMFRVLEPLAVMVKPL